MCIRECVSAYVCVGTAHEACDVYFTDDHVGIGGFVCIECVCVGATSYVCVRHECVYVQ